MNKLPTLAEVPAHLANRLNAPSALSDQVSSGLGGTSIPRISIKSSRFRLVVGDSEVLIPTSEIDVIIVGASPGLSKTWYSKPWTPESDDNAAPDCFSFDGVTPDKEAKLPQNGVCASCPHNAWGSRKSPSGQETKSCADQKRLAVVGASAPDQEIYLLLVTPSALKGLNTYQRELTARGIPAEIVVTKISFDPEASYPKLVFSFGGFLHAEQISVVDTLFGSDKVKGITGEIYREPVEVQIAPPPAAPLPAPVVEPEPAAPQAVEAELVEEVPDFEADSKVVELASAFGAPAKPAKKKAAKKKAAKPVAPVAPVAPADTHGFGTPSVEPAPAPVAPEVPGITVAGSETLKGRIQDLLDGKADG